MKNLYRRNTKNFLSLNTDSLIDIVSNCVGILLIITAFISIFSIIKSTPEKVENMRLMNQSVKILIPWSHYSQKTAILFLIRNNKVIRFNRSEYYKKLGNKLMGSEPISDESISFSSYKVELETHGGYQHCLIFVPFKNAGIKSYKFLGKKNHLGNIINNTNKSEFYFFFWVTSDSFDFFRDLRNVLWKKDFEVGWKPIKDVTNLKFCNGYVKSKSFLPQ